MAKIAIFLYRLLGDLIVLPLAFFLRNHPNFRSTIPQRLAWSLPEIPPGQGAIWVHAASVGEVKAVSGLLRKIKVHQPGTVICLSSMTATGRQVAKGVPEIDVVFPLPFDLHGAMRRYLLRIMPSVLIIVETEIWPNMLLAAQDLSVPVVFVNARMTKVSFARYEKVHAVIREVLKDVRVFAMAKSDGERFSRLGARRVELLGNLKLDSVAEVDPKRSTALREELGIEHRPVFIAGSIREGEEEEVIEAMAYASAHVPGLYGIVAPRHPGMLATLTGLADRKGLSWGLRTEMRKGIDLLFVDTMGELFDLYGAADVAFVGGSLKDLGGQNILEPIAWGVPTIHGPYMDNFTWALEAVEGSTIRIQRPSELGPTAAKVIHHIDRYRDMAREARESLNTRRGVGDRYLQALKRFLGRETHTGVSNGISTS